MSTIYLMDNGVKVSKDGGKIVITKLDGTKKELPSAYVECIVVCCKANITCDVIQLMLRENKSIIYLDKDRCVLGTVGPIKNRGRLCLKQLEFYKEDEERMAIADKIISKKILAQRDLLITYNKRLKSEYMKAAIAKLSVFSRNASNQKDVKKLMGLEGLSARTYFDCFKEILCDSPFEWNGRKKHPAPDPVNCMLSFAYALTEKDVRIALAKYGLLPEVGFVHELNFRKDSLVYDLLEPFRPAIADRFVLRCINWKMFNLDDFETMDGKCFFKAEARKKFVTAYEDFVGSIDDSEDCRNQINITVAELLSPILNADFGDTEDQDD